VRGQVQEGKIKEWGVSNETTFGVCTICEAARKLGVKPPVAIQNDGASGLRMLFHKRMRKMCFALHAWPSCLPCCNLV
jgi:aryl-alcohol dehydrogenase-like predicted oxidoreductase